AARRQINADARAEADHADALAGADLLAFAHERHDAARDEPRDLHHADAPARAGNDEAVALVVLARLVEVGVEEFARLVRHAFDASADRAAVHVAIEHAHENGNPGERGRSKPQLGRRAAALPLLTPAAGRPH